MTLYSFRRNSMDPLIISAGAITFLFVLCVFFFGEIQMYVSGSFSMSLQGISLTASSLLLQLGFILSFMSILGFSKTFLDILEEGNLAMLLSKPISRTEFILKNTWSVIILTFLYCICTGFLFSILFLLKNASIPYQFIVAILFLPVAILALYSIILFCSLILESYAVTVFFTFIYTFAIHPWLLNSDILVFRYGVKNSILLTIIDILTLILPNTFGAINLMGDWLEGDFTFRGFLAIAISIFPVFLLTILIMNKKEF